MKTRGQSVLAQSIKVTPTNISDNLIGQLQQDIDHMMWRESGGKVGERDNRWGNGKVISSMKPGLSQESRTCYNCGQARPSETSDESNNR